MKIKYGISYRSDGSMKYLRGNDTNIKNRRDFFKKLDLDINNVVLAGLEHGAKVVIVDESFGGMNIDGVDALITDRPEVILAVTVADCIPLYVFSEKRKILALAHISWMGLNKGIVKAVAKVIKDSYRINLDGFQAIIGPHIKDCCYEVKEDVSSKFSKYPRSIKKRKGKIYFDLEAVVVEQLKEMGMDKKAIIIDKDCTRCEHDKYFSHRFDQTNPVNAQVAYIYIDK